MRVAPPTSTTPWTSSTVTPASRSARRTGASVFCTRVAVSSAKVSALSTRWTVSPVESTASTSVLSAPDNHSLAARALFSSRRVSSADSGCRPACSTIQQAMR